MAAISYLVLSPSGFMGVIGLLHGPDKTVPTPQENWRDATVDLVIPTHNEESNIVLCLASILKQTLKPKRVILFDDASTDSTVRYAKDYAQMAGLELTIMQRDHSEGKTPSINFIAHESQADVLFVIDGDTMFGSDNYIERLVQELYQGVGIACACGMIFPLTERDRKVAFTSDHLAAFAEKNPQITYSPDQTKWQRLLRKISSIYREELYLFLQRFIYHGEMVFFGTLIFPIGCAVAYRRKNIQELFDRYADVLGNDLTTSEDIFIGFSFADEGYRNIVVQDVHAFTMEPRLGQLWKQIFKWSSAFLQSCYYFNALVATPFKFPRYLFKRTREKFGKTEKMMQEKRKIKEAYRQAFGTEYTKKYGRNIGWFVFTSALEKLSFPTIIIIFVILKLWIPLVVTIIAEILLYSLIIVIMHGNRRIRNFLKAVFLITPIRYCQLMFDVYVIGNFAKDIWIKKDRRWRK